ncbi:unnamed protein product [Ixodes pacificus]
MSRIMKKILLIDFLMSENKCTVYTVELWVLLVHCCGDGRGGKRSPVCPLDWRSLATVTRWTWGRSGRRCSCWRGRRSAYTASSRSPARRQPSSTFSAPRPPGTSGSWSRSTCATSSGTCAARTTTRHGPRMGRRRAACWAAGRSSRCECRTPCATTDATMCAQCPS